MRVIISGGGSGGHIFPAIAIAEKIKEELPLAEILFVGAEGKMEMEKVPKAGFEIKALPIRGLQRKLTLKNLSFPFRLIVSLWKARGIIKSFKPDLVIGVGGYASGPIMRIATGRKIKTLVQEQNSYPGITNKLLASRVDKICVAYPNMERFFSKEKIVFTGNPVRKGIEKSNKTKTESRKHFGLSADKKTILLFGGSLGAKTLNEAMRQASEVIATRPDVQWIWQAGKLYIDDFQECATAKLPNVKIMAFIDKMEYAYEASELALTRAGALSISELALVGQASVLIPSPNVAEDHQTKNAMALVEADAARIIKDSKAKEQMVEEALELIEDSQALESLKNNIVKLARPNATDLIMKEIRRLRR